LPLSSNIACAAAVSHSIVGAILGYISALPSATIQSFNELPFEIEIKFWYLFFRLLINSCVSLEGCDLLATIVNSLFFLDKGIFCLFKNAPSPFFALYILSIAGAYTIPKTGVSMCISAIFIVNSPFFFINSFVPSIGSMHQ